MIDSFCEEFLEKCVMKVQKFYYLGDLQGDVILYDVNGELMIKLIYFIKCFMIKHPN